MRIAAAAVLCAGVAACGGAEWPPRQWQSVHGTDHQGGQRRNAAVSPPPNSQVISIRPGDTLYRISSRHGTSIEQLIELNGISDPNAIYAGDRLVVPGGDGQQVASASSSTPRRAATAPTQPAPPPARTPTSTGPSVSMVTSEELPPPSGKGTSAAAPSSAPLPSSSAPPSASPPSSSRTVSASTAPSAPPPVAEETATAANARTGAIATTPPPSPVKAAVLPTPPARAAANFAWPVRGRVVSGYGVKGPGYRNDGINIEAPRGAPIMAAENGVVVYAGNEVAGFGNLVLLRHDGGYVTAYAHADQLMVQRGQVVHRGQQIATVGSSGNVTEPQLHFEIREGVTARDPRRLMASQT